MNTDAVVVAPWSTASFGHATGATLLDQSALRQHLDLCRKSCGRLFALQRGAETMHGFLASRFVTTLAMIAFFIGVGCLVL